jgi:uncharacterized protein (TIGR02147 family)
MNSSATEKLSVFDFLDYRKFLGHFYELHKETERNFSHRAMAKNAGFSSPNFLKLVIDGKRNIGKESLAKITVGLGLTQKEAEYFSYLVFFAQARKKVEKNYYFGLIAALRAHKNIRTVTSEQFEYFNEWYHPAIRELIVGRTDPVDFEALSMELGNKVSAAKIRKSLELLKRLGLVSYDTTKGYIHNAPILNTSNEIHSFAIRHFHNEVLGVAKTAVENTPPAERENSHITARLSPDGFTKIKNRIQEFREELLQIVGDDRNAFDIYHINFQLYPIAKSQKL